MILLDMELRMMSVSGFLLGVGPQASISFLWCKSREEEKNLLSSIPIAETVRCQKCPMVAGPARLFADLRRPFSGLAPFPRTVLSTIPLDPQISHHITLWFLVTGRKLQKWQQRSFVLPFFPKLTKLL
jgi:hypothetical protein